MSEKYRPVIGLEIHAELNTKTKMFCDSIYDPDEKHPNINVCPICLAHPGTLPVINSEAVKKVIMAGLALNCKIAEDTFFERKNYFYPDLPKGYQISQYQKPLCEGGYLDLQPTTYNLQPKRVRITRIHLEEDAGRLYHLADKEYSLVDYNRAGVPLMELVTEPDLESGREVKKFAEEFQLILRYLGISDANMEKGQMRVEVNISLTNDQRPTTNDKHKLGTKVEIKNLNSIKAASDSVDYEIKRQTEILDNGKQVAPETMGWDEFKKRTVSQRSKEEANDYRYFPEPDLPPLSQLSAISRQLSVGMPELPSQRRQRFKRQYNLPDADVEVFTVNKPLGDYFESVASELLSFDKLDHLKKPGAEHQDRLFKLASNYLITELQKMFREVLAEPYDTKISPEMFADLMVRIFHAEVSSSGAQTVLKEMFEKGSSPDQIIKGKNLVQLSSIGELESVVSEVLADNKQAIEDYRKGKSESIKFLIGKVMAKTKGRANPQMVEEIIKKKLGA